MQLFIANITKQAHDFAYRRPETGQIIRIPIMAGHQIPLNVQQGECDAIINQHSRYGMIPVKEIKRGKHFNGLAYSIDKPINVDAIRAGIEHNDETLEDLALEARKNAAVAVDSALTEIGRNGGAKVKSFEVEVEEVVKKGDNRDGFRQNVEVQREGRKLRTRRDK